jgi:hypothetical protein
MLADQMVTLKPTPLPGTFMWDQPAILQCRTIVERFTHAITYIHSLRSAGRYEQYSPVNRRVNAELLQKGCAVELRLPAGSDIFRTAVMADIAGNGINSSKARENVLAYLLSELGVAPVNIQLDCFSHVAHSLGTVRVTLRFCVRSLSHTLAFAGDRLAQTNRRGQLLGPFNFLPVRPRPQHQPVWVKTKSANSDATIA